MYSVAHMWGVYFNLLSLLLHLYLYGMVFYLSCKYVISRILWWRPRYKSLNSRFSFIFIVDYDWVYCLQLTTTPEFPRCIMKIMQLEISALQISGCRGLGCNMFNIHLGYERGFQIVHLEEWLMITCQFHIKKYKPIQSRERRGNSQVKIYEAKETEINGR